MQLAFQLSQSKLAAVAEQAHPLPDAPFIKLLSLPAAATFEQSCSKWNRHTPPLGL